jgi:hypothetical protein
MVKSTAVAADIPVTPSLPSDVKTKPRSHHERIAAIVKATAASSHPVDLFDLKSILPSAR